MHFAILTVARQSEASGLAWASFLFSFKWPSAAYMLDILAWDIFYAFSMLFAAPVFKEGKLERTLRVLMALSGIL